MNSMRILFRSTVIKYYRTNAHSSRNFIHSVCMLTEVRNLTTTWENLYVKFTSVTYIRCQVPYITCQVTYITCQVTYKMKSTCSQKAKDLVNCHKISLSDYVFIVSFPYLSRDYLSCNDKKYKMLTLCYVLPKKLIYKNT
jgi:hypothetical protein